MDKQLIETFISAGLKNGKSSVLMAVLDLDIICCESIAKKASYSSYRNRISEMIYNFSEANEADARSILEEFVKTDRKYFKFLIDGREDLFFRNAFRGTIHSWLLFLISQKKPVVSWKIELGNYTSDLPDNWHEKPREEIIEEYVDLFHTVYKDLSTDDLNRVCDISNTFSIVATHFKKILYSIYENDGERSARYAKPVIHDRTMFKSVTQPLLKRKENFFDSKENRIILQCMAEYYLSVTPNSSKQKWHAFLHNTWKKFYPGILLSDTIQDELDNLLEVFSNNNSDNKKTNNNFQRYMRALGIVINHGNVQNIRSEAVLRILVVNRTVAMTLSLMDPNKAGKRETEDVLQDVSAYLSYINYVTNKAEEDDLVESMSLYLENGRFSPNSIKRVAQYSNMWKKSFHDMKVYLNSRNKAVSVLNDRIDEMETTLDKADYNSMKNMVLNLDRGGFGFCLGKLYRFANALDDLSIQETRTLLSCYFSMLNNMGIKPVDSGRLDTIIHEQEELFSNCVPEAEDMVNGDRLLSYPGWSVKDSVVALPVYKIKEN